MVSSSTTAAEVKQMEHRSAQENGGRWSDLALLACAIFVVLAYILF
jgi:hypothetical protein